MGLHGTKGEGVKWQGVGQQGWAAARRGATKGGGGGNGSGSGRTGQQWR